MTDTALKNEGLAARLDRLVSPFYDRDGITIYNADCRQVLPFLDRFDLLLTDPPYGIGEARGKNKSRDNQAVARDYGSAEWDDAPPDRWLLDQMRQLSEWQIVFGGNFFELPPSPCWLVWHKKDCASDFADCELAWTNRTGAVRYHRHLWSGYWQEDMGNKDVRVHPTQKPLSLMKWCCSLVPDAKSVLDPFMGSGTTLVAAKLLGLRAVGIEINREYCEAAVERLRQGVLDFGSEG